MNPLEISSQQFRRMAEIVTQIAIKYVDTLNTRPIFPECTGAATEKLFRTDLAEEGLGEGALTSLETVVRHCRAQNGRFFGYVLGSGDPVAALADLLASVLNQNVTAWRSAPAAVTIERQVVRWVAQEIGCEAMSGSLCGGGSSANLMALAMAREAKLPANECGAQPGLVYASSEVHMSIAKAVALLGLGRRNLRLVPVDDRFRMSATELDSAIRRDLDAGQTPIAVVATAGTV